MTNHQGTAWETQIESEGRARDLPTVRLVKRAEKDEAERRNPGFKVVSHRWVETGLLGACWRFELEAS